MIRDIFSSFDSVNYFSFIGGRWIWWIIEIMIINLFIIRYWCQRSRVERLIVSVSSIIFQEVKRRRGRLIGGFLNVLVSLFFLILIINFLGLIPYVYSLRSQGAITFVLGLPLWITLIISRFSWNWFLALAHYLPLGAPAVLNPFLVIIEFVSDFVRPITLSARLAANISAGHIVLGLIGVYLCKGIFSIGLIFIILLILQIGYFFFEVGVCAIQAYIFSLLPSLYANDHRIYK